MGHFQSPQIEAKAMEAGAAAEATVDGREFAALGRVDKERYVNRFADGLSAYLAALRTAEPVEAAAPSEEPVAVPTFYDIAKYKLNSLMADGWVVNGYSLIKDEERRGFIDFGGFVGWWLPEYYVGHTSGASPAVAPVAPGTVGMTLRSAAERVCWFDWSGNDPDAVQAVDALLAALSAQDTDGVAK